MNVQHLESLNDQVTELTGVRVRETVPDAVLGRADEVVLVDLTPEALLERLRAGKVYPPERIEAALNGFFRIENLAALREVALRQVAEEVEAKRLVDRGRRRRARSVSRRRAAGRRRARCSRSSSRYPGAQRLVRRAWRSAQRLGAELDLLWVAPPGASLDDEQERGLRALRQLASVLGARAARRGVATTSPRPSREVARERGTTYILMGALARRRAGSRACATPLPQRLMRARCPASTCGSSPTAPHATRGGRHERSVVDRRRGRRRLSRSALGRLVPPAAARRAARRGAGAARARILLPFTGEAISRRALDAAVRLARAEDATLMPAYLATRAARTCRSTRALPAQCAHGDAAAGGDRAARRARQGVAVDARVSRGRTYRDALRRLLAGGASTASSSRPPTARATGLSADDLEWLLERAPAEVLILRPDPDDHREVTAPKASRATSEGPPRFVLRRCRVQRGRGGPYPRSLPRPVPRAIYPCLRHAPLPVAAVEKDGSIPTRPARGHARWTGVRGRPTRTGGAQPVTRASSANEVSPARTFSRPSSRRRRIPPRRAASAIASAEARRDGQRRISSVTGMTS